jgi:tape measure domain-containing protein
LASGLLATAEVGLRLEAGSGFRRSVVDAASKAGDAAGKALGDAASKSTGTAMRDGRSRFLRAGTDAGTAVGEGFTRNVGTGLRAARGQFVTEGGRAGAGFGTGLTRGSSGLLSRFTAQMERGGAKAGSAIVRGANSAASNLAGVGAKAGRSFVSGLTSAARTGVAAFGVLTVAAGAFGLRTVASLESSQIAFEVFLGSAKKATAFIRQLQKLAESTPFEFTDLTRLSQRLLAAGFNAKRVVPTIVAIGDAVAGLGGTPELLGQVANAFAQIQTKGKLSNEELLQLSEAGVPAVRILADALGVTTAQLQKMAEQGKISSETAIPALVAGIEKGTKSVQGFGGMMARQSQTLSGLFSTLKDTAATTLANLIAPHLPAIKAGVQQLIAALGQASTIRVGVAALAGITAFITYLNAHRKDIATFTVTTVQLAAQGGAAMLRFGAAGLTAMAGVIEAIGGLVAGFTGAAAAIVGTARTAFSWVPGVRQRLSGAEEAIARFGKQAQASMNNTAAGARRGAAGLNTAADALDGVSSAAGRARAALNRMPTTKTVTVRVRDAATGTIQTIQRNIDRMTGRVLSVQVGSIAHGITAKAGGGPVTRGQAYLIGEQGPEIMVPASSGTVVNAATTAAARSRSNPPGSPVAIGGGLSAADRQLLEALASRPVVVAVDGREIARVVRKRDTLDAQR